MDENTLRVVLIAAVVGLASMWVFASFFVRVGGIWIQEESTAPGHKARAHEAEIELAQLGPWISGRRDVPGGVQEFSGVLIGRTLRLKRRDRGVSFLMDSGFPEGIARQVDGNVTARLRLKLVDGGTRLEGAFTPNKVEFTHQPPRITSTYSLAPVSRSYRRVTPVGALEHDALAAEPAEPT